MTPLRPALPCLVGSPATGINLAGEWIGRYPGHFDETVLITQHGTRVEAVKITGDEHVPAGETTWRADLATLLGEGQIAGHEFRAPRFVPGRLEILGPDLIAFHWDNVGSVEYRRDD